MKTKLPMIAAGIVLAALSVDAVVLAVAGKHPFTYATEGATALSASAKALGAACYREGYELGKLEDAVAEAHAQGRPVPVSVLKLMAATPTKDCK